MPATLQPRPMRAKHLVAKGDPEQTKKNYGYVGEHLRTDGFMLQQPKIDGMRILFDDGVARSRTWLPWTSKTLQAFAAAYPDFLHGWDCEGLPGLHDTTEVDPDAFRRAMSGIRAADGSKEMTLFLFDNWDHSWSKIRYEQRLQALKDDIQEKVSNLGDSHWEHGYDGIIFKGTDYIVKVIICPTTQVRSIDEIEAYHLDAVARGWEGSMLRRWVAPYKYNQATVREGWLIKLKDTEDAEAEIIGYEPAYENTNEATTNALGLTQRSAHKANLVPKDYLGAFLVRLVSDPSVEFSIGVLRGYTIEDRRDLLRQAETGALLGRLIKFEHQGYGGGYDKPRTPVMVSFRDKIDV